MKIKMKETKKGSPDGVLVLEYQKGKTYDLPDRLSDAFIRAGWATAVRPQEPKETKVIEPEEKKVEEPEETKVEKEETPKPEEKKEEAVPEKKEKK